MHLWKVVDLAFTGVGLLLIGCAFLLPFAFYLFSPGMRKTTEAKDFFVGVAFWVGLLAIVYLAARLVHKYR
jgi:hypothetical protein